jgi:hypothetical protein
LAAAATHVSVEGTTVTIDGVDAVEGGGGGYQRSRNGTAVVDIRRPNMTNSSHHSYQIVLMFTLGHSYGWSKLSTLKFKHKWTVHKLNVHTVNLI